MSAGFSFEHLLEKLVAVLVVASLVGGASGCNPKASGGPAASREKVSLAAIRSAFAAPWFVAEAKGLFADEGLDATLVPYPSGVEALEAMFSGQVDFGASGDVPLAITAVEGRPFRILATVVESSRAVRIVARKDRGILVPSDLKGKRIGRMPHTSNDFYLHRFLAVSRIDLDEVHLLAVSAEGAVEALLRGEVDALSAQPHHAVVAQERLGSRATVFEDQDLYLLVGNIVATPEFSASHPQTSKKVLRALRRADAYLADHPDEARALTESRLGIDARLLRLEWKDARFVTKLDQSLILGLEDQARWIMEERGRNPADIPNFMRYIRPDELKALAPDAVTIPGY